MNRRGLSMPDAVRFLLRCAARNKQPSGDSWGRRDGIKRYDPSMLEQIDLGLVSVHKAYQIVRNKYMKTTKKTFESELIGLFKKYKVTNSDDAYNLMMNTMDNLNWSPPKN